MKRMQDVLMKKGYSIVVTAFQIAAKELHQRCGKQILWRTKSVEIPVSIRSLRELQ